eukprot:gene36307-8559_t
MSAALPPTVPGTVGGEGGMRRRRARAELITLHTPPSPASPSSRGSGQWWPGSFSDSVSADDAFSATSSSSAVRARARSELLRRVRESHAQRHAPSSRWEQPLWGAPPAPPPSPADGHRPTPPSLLLMDAQRGALSAAIDAALPTPARPPLHTLSTPPLSPRRGAPTPPTPPGARAAFAALPANAPTHHAAHRGGRKGAAPGDPAARAEGDGAGRGSVGDDERAARAALTTQLAEQRPQVRLLAGPARRDAQAEGALGAAAACRAEAAARGAVSDAEEQRRAELRGMVAAPSRVPGGTSVQPQGRRVLRGAYAGELLRAGLRAAAIAVAAKEHSDVAAAGAAGVGDDTPALITVAVYMVAVAGTQHQHQQHQQQHHQQQRQQQQQQQQQRQQHQQHQQQQQRQQHQQHQQQQQRQQQQERGRGPAHRGPCRWVWYGKECGNRKYKLIAQAPGHRGMLGVGGGWIAAPNDTDTLNTTSGTRLSCKDATDPEDVRLCSGCSPPHTPACLYDVDADEEERHDLANRDWTCSHCGEENYAHHRTCCYKCGGARDGSGEKGGVWGRGGGPARSVWGQRANRRRTPPQWHPYAACCVLRSSAPFPRGGPKKPVPAPKEGTVR